MALRGQYFFVCFVVLLIESQAQTVVPDFDFPSSICAGDPFTIVNQTSGGSTFKWKFCAKDLNQSPSSQSFGDFGGLLDQPNYIDVVFTNNNYYGFVTNFGSGDLIRLDFGNSLMNNPTAVNLGTVNGLLPSGGNGGIQVVQDQGKWYAIIVSGYPPGGINPRISKIDFGTNITNLNPIGTNWGNQGNMYDPNDLILVHEGNTWIAITVNGETNTISRFNFGSSLDNSPIGTNMGNLGDLGEPAGLYLTHVNGESIVFVTNSGNKTRTGGYFNITRLNFGNSLLNTPSAVNIGNVSNMLQHPRDITLAPYCNQTLGFVLNGHPFYNSLLKVDFDNDIFSSLPTAAELGSQSGFDYPNAIAGFFSEGEKLIALVTNRNSNTVSRLVFEDCNNASIPASSAKDPPPVSYNQPGVYNIQLIVDEGLASETSLCKQVVITSCTDSLIITNDTTICSGEALQIVTHPAVQYQWTPATFLDDPTLASPTTTATQNIEYFVDALVKGDNLVVNGDFTSGNTGFASDYQFTATNVTEGQYFVAKDPKTWNISLDFCADHTSGSGNMLLVNGSPTPSYVIWSQAINVKANTSYYFSTWLQTVWPTNPASVQLFVNGTAVGGATNALAATCTWTEAGAIWNSGASTTAILTIVDLNTAIVGNDFALDDISFTELIPVRDSISITVKQPFIKASGDTTICEGISVNLNVENGSFFLWSPATGLSSNDVPNPIATPATTTQYVVEGVDPSGCLAKDSVLIIVKPSPVITVTNDTSICPGAAVQLNATGGGTYQWSPVTGLNDATIPDPVVNTMNDAIYKVRVTSGNECYREDSVKISVRQLPQFAASGPEAVCAGSAVTLIAEGGDTYQWLPANEIPNANAATVSFVPPVTSTYTVHISENVCHHDTIIQLSVRVDPVPTITATKSNDINCTFPSAQLHASGAQAYVWTPATAINDATIASPVAVPDTTTTYTVTGVNEAGCTAEVSVTVNVDRSGVPRFVVPNAFTPNNDGRNDCFGIQRWGNADIKQFSIYNRWGTLIFTATDPSQCWDGTWQGIPQSGGGYIYVIRANTLCGEITRKGIITLIR